MMVMRPAAPHPSIHDGTQRDTGQVQVESILLVSPFVPADELLDDGSHVGEPGGGEEGGEGG